MLTSDQLAARKIGGSDIGVILGLNPWRMPIDLYREKIGEAQPFQGNEHTQAGEVMEGAIADLYELRTGRPVRRSNLTHVHKEHDFLTAHVDRVAVGEKRIIEIKNIGRNGAKAWGQPGTDAVPTASRIWSTALYWPEAKKNCNERDTCCTSASRNGCNTSLT